MHASYKPWPSSPGFLSLMWSPCLPAHSCPFPHSSWNHWWCLVTLSIKSKLLTLPCDASVTWPCLAFLTNFVLPSPCPSLSSPCFLSVFEHIKFLSCFYLWSCSFCVEWPQCPIIAFPAPSCHFHFLLKVTSLEHPSLTTQSELVVWAHNLVSFSSYYVLNFPCLSNLF